MALLGDLEQIRVLSVLALEIHRPSAFCAEGVYESRGAAGALVL